MAGGSSSKGRREKRTEMSTWRSGPPGEPDGPAGDCGGSWSRICSSYSSGSPSTLWRGGVARVSAPAPRVPGCALHLPLLLLGATPPVGGGGGGGGRRRGAPPGREPPSARRGGVPEAPGAQGRGAHGSPPSGREGALYSLPFCGVGPREGSECGPASGGGGGGRHRVRGASGGVRARGPGFRPDPSPARPPVFTLLESRHAHLQSPRSQTGAEIASELGEAGRCRGSSGCPPRGGGPWRTWRA